MGAAHAGAVKAGLAARRPGAGHGLACVGQRVAIVLVAVASVLHLAGNHSVPELFTSGFRKAGIIPASADARLIEGVQRLIDQAPDAPDVQPQTADAPVAAAPDSQQHPGSVETPAPQLRQDDR